MKIPCKVFVFDRTPSDRPLSQTRRHVQSTMALCKQLKSEEYCLILFGSKHKKHRVSVQYELRRNVKQILTRFIHEGKCTIQMLSPEHDLFVQADATQLKSFLHVLRQVLYGQVALKEIRESSETVKAIDHNKVAPKKLVILNRSDYPLKGFPRTLETLIINDIKRCGLDRGILNLTRLRNLDLSNNLIELLPEEFSKLNVVELNLSGNRFGLSAPRKWDWMGGNLSNCLKLIDLSKNMMKYLPEQILKLHSLITMKCNNNELTKLPSGIGNLLMLQNLNASYNCLFCLPGSIKKLVLDTIDIAHNKFNDSHRQQDIADLPKQLNVLTLRDYAARKVLRLRLPYSSETLPPTIIKYMELAKYCVCGNACFEDAIVCMREINICDIAKFSSFTNESSNISTECYFCSLHCIKSNKKLRHPFVR